MSDSRRHASTRGSISLVPGVIYEWTPDGVAPVPLEEEDSQPALYPFVAGTEPITGYRLAERLGEGCTGEVWRAIGPGGVAVALKFVAARNRGAAQELRSLTAMLGVRHANLITIFGIWERDDWTAIGMDLADGSLQDQFDAATALGRRGLDFAELTDFLRQAARGLDFLNHPTHALLGQAPLSLVHRDIKPQNLLLVGGSVKVGDFGLVRRLEAGLDLAGEATDEGIESQVTVFTSPEVRRGGLSGRSDQYALAATYCHLRAGCAPPTSRPAAPVEPDAVDLTMLPPGERPAVARALAADPAQRWPSCSAFVEALVASAWEPRLAAPPPTAPETAAFPAPPRRRSRRRDLAALLAATAALVAFASSWSGGSSPLRPAMAARRDPIATATPSPPTELSTDSVAETTLVAAPAPALEAVAAPAPAAIAPPAGLVVVPPTGQEALPEPVVAASYVVATSPAAAAGPDPVVSPAADPFDAIVAAIEAHPVDTEKGLPPSGPEPMAALRVWVTATSDRLVTRVAAARVAATTWVESLPHPAPSTAASPFADSARTPVIVSIPKTAAITIPARPDPPAGKAATIIVRMPNLKAELIVRGEVGPGNTNERTGPRRVIHSPPLTASRDYLIGSSWVEPGGKQVTRSLPLKVEPGQFYEVDLRPAMPTASEVSPPPSPRPTPVDPVPQSSQRRPKDASPRKHNGPLNRLLPHLKSGGRQAARP